MHDGAVPLQEHGSRVGEPAALHVAVEPPIPVAAHEAAVSNETHAAWCVVMQCAALLRCHPLLALKRLEPANEDAPCYTGTRRGEEE